MADISIINKDNTDYNVKDAAGRLALAEVENKGAKNILRITASSGKLNTATIDIANDGSIHITGQPTSNGAYVLSSGIDLLIPENAYILSRGTEAGNTKMSLSLRRKGTTQYVDLYSAESIIIPSGTYDRLHVYLYADTIYNTNIYPMICTKAEWDISHTYVPYGKTNAELTAENTSQQAEINYAINTGVKNLFPITASGTQTIGGVVFTVNSDGTITANGTKTNNDWLILSENNSFGAGTYTLSDGLPVDTTDCQLIITTARSMTAAIMATAANARPQTKTFTTEQTGLYYAIRIASGKTVNNLTFKPMIRPASITDSTFVSYAKTNVDLTNENANQQLEIDYAINTGVKNILNSVCHDIGEPVSSQGRTLTMLPDGGIKIEGTHTGSANYADFYLMGAWSGTKYVMNLSNVPHIASIQAPDLTSDSDKAMIYLHIYDRHTGSTVQSVSPTSNISGSTFNFDPTAIYISVYKNLSIPTGGIVVYPMIRRAEITDATFQQYALSNPVITPAAIKAVDEGAKNLCNWSESTSTVEHVTFTINSDKTVSTSGTATARSQKALFFTVPSTLKAGRYVLSGCPSGGEQSGTVLYCLYLWDLTANARVASGNDTGNGLEFYWIPDSSHTYNISIDVRSGTNASGLIFKPMICTATDWSVSQKFVPYAPTNRELYEDVYEAGTKIAANTNLNGLKTHGLYYSTSTQDIASFTNCPVSAQFTLSVKFGSQAVFQEIQPMSKTEIMYRYVRMFTNGTWSSWYKFEGTEVT